MKIRTAKKTDLDTVRLITRTTINNIYPHYYPSGAVDFFLKHHNDENILQDISLKRVYISYDTNNNAVGTVNVKENEITRLFVLPRYQGNGYGKELLDLAESEIRETYDEAKIDASLSAKAMYIKHGYKETEYHIKDTENGDCLCYDIMVKQLTAT